MPIRLTNPLLGSRAAGYHNRVMVYAHRRGRASYLAPKKAHKQDPTANKPTEEYGNTWDPRSGIEWYYRMRNRNHYRHWPWARWTDDPVRFHEDPTNRRTFSALGGALNEGFPEWNYYEEVGQAYETPSHFPLSYAGPFIHQYTGKVWTTQQLESSIAAVAQGTGLTTIADVAANKAGLRAWGQRQSGSSSVPLGLLLHLELVCEDIVQQNARTVYRAEQQQAGVLRTREMARYYALPRMRVGPAMPQALEQPSGEYPWGRHTYAKDPVDYHPLQQPDGRYKHNMYPI